MCAGLPLCLAAAGASAQMQLQTAQHILTQGEVYRVAPLTVVDGQWILGEFGPWRNHDEQIAGRTLFDAPAIDAYEYDWTLGPPYIPTGADLCSTAFAGSTRYFFGTTVTAPHYCNDFRLTRPETFGKRIELFGHTLWWNPATPEACFIIVRFWDDFNRAGDGTINPTTTGFNVGMGDANLAAKNGLGGFVVELRSSITAPVLTGTAAGYRIRYYNFKNEPGINVCLPTDGNGATEMIIARSLNGWDPGWTEPNQPPPGANRSGPIPGPLTYQAATGPAQSMLWSMDNNDPNPSTPRRAGDEVSCVMWMELEEPGAYTTNGTFLYNPPARNDFYGLGCTTAWVPGCVNVGGFMYLVVTADQTCGTPCPGTGAGACSRADWNEDGVIDFNDFLAFLNDFNTEDPCADLNQDSVVDFNDFLEFLNIYNAGC
jgi:hypothetical protein